MPVKFTMHRLFVRRRRCAPVKNRAQISLLHVKSGQVVCSLKVADLTQFADYEWLRYNKLSNLHLMALRYANFN